jgi:hypothetical protein|tara:strand:+ start:271 stop:465 length:195 start_codon:yes stop_codon:yes gene_type:complete
MTRKDYKVIAEALRKSMPAETVPFDIKQQNTWSDVVATIAEELNAHYANFNSSMFYQACGIGAE